MVDDTTLRRLEAESAVLLPRELALCIAIEAERALQEAAALLDLEVRALADRLDQEASVGYELGPRPLLVRALEDYGAALARGLDPRSDRDDTFHARVPHHVAARWAHSAAESGKSLEHWIYSTLEDASGNRAAWEASAARSARPLTEWVLVQAVRWKRS